MSDAEPTVRDRLTLANRLLDAMEFDNAIQRMAFRTVPNRPEAEEAAERASAAFSAKHVTPQVLRGPLAGAYARLFSAQELVDLVAFYESPTGRKLTATQPELADTLQAAVSRVYQDHLGEFSRDVLGMPDQLSKRPE